jgi:uncharacterized metal-binding protein
MGDGSCLCEPTEVLIFSCSGASNLGQIANETAFWVREAGKGTMYCTAGIGGRVPGLVDGARNAKVLVGIEGCPIGCVKRCLEAEGLAPVTPPKRATHLVLSTLATYGIEMHGVSWDGQGGRTSERTRRDPDPEARPHHGGRLRGFGATSERTPSHTRGDWSHLHSGANSIS